MILEIVAGVVIAGLILSNETAVQVLLVVAALAFVVAVFGGFFLLATNS